MLDRQTLSRSWRSWHDHSVAPHGPWWLQWVWTLLFCVPVAAVYTVINFVLFASGEGAWRNVAGWWHWYQLNLLMSVCIGISIHALFELVAWAVGRPRLAALRGLRRHVFYVGVPLLGVLLGWSVGALLLGGDWSQWFNHDASNVWFGMLLLSAISLFATFQFFDLRNRRSRAERNALEAQLRLLQGQIEPHFLFNTLANVLSLMDADPGAARRMLESFVDYLRGSVGSLQQTQRTLGDELHLVEAYLRILQMRMHDRLQVHIDVPPALHALPLPPLTLQPLVENAVRHGLEPKVEGGTVRIRARTVADVLELVIEDDGLGLPPAGGTAAAGRGSPGDRPAGTGTAIRNTQDRLRALFGETATLQLQTATPCGARAVLRLPLPAMAAAGTGPVRRPTHDPATPASAR